MNMIKVGSSKHHWNYFLAIERDLENVSRFIEFNDDNLLTYSIELTHILLSTSSEIDVVMKQLCKLAEPSKTTNNINEYREVIKNYFDLFPNQEVSISRYGMKFNPWLKWVDNENPNWWKSHNNIKHERNNYFKEANLQNTLNAVGALMITVIYYYKELFSKEIGKRIDLRETVKKLTPYSGFLKISGTEITVIGF